MARVVVTVDGLAGSGKSTLSQRLAERLHFVHLNSGLLYRAVAYLTLAAGVAPEDEGAVVGIMKTHTIALELADPNSAVAVVRVDGRVMGEEFRTPEVSECTSRISVHRRVREALLAAQREAFPDRNLVAEGRDMGTVVFPDAERKFFVMADPQVRVERRVAQLRKTQSGSDLAQIERQMLIEITERDERDMTRQVAPTKAATGAIIIDNSTKPLAQVVEEMAAAVCSCVQESR